MPRYRYDRLTPEQLSAALDQIGLTPNHLARLHGSKSSTVVKWLRGEEQAPHSVTVLLTLLTLPGALELAKAITDKMVVEEISDDD